MKKQAWHYLLPSGQTFIISVPFLWFALFLFIPFLIVFRISFSETVTAIPPYSDLFSAVNDTIQLTLNFRSYLYLFTDSLYVSAYLNSLKIAFFSTLFCLLVGYPMAYAIVKAKPSMRNLLLMLVILPSWTSFLIRVYAWMGILKNNGLINNFLINLGIINEPLTLLHTDFAVYVGVVYAYLPFMILPLYANIIKMDHTLLEAASDLGARPWQAFLKITLPLSKAGIISGSMLVFIPVVGEFVVPDLLGGPDTLMIGKVLWNEFFNNRDWPAASSVAVVMLLLLVAPILLFNRYQDKEYEK